MKIYKGLMENVPYPGHKSFLEGREQVEDETRAGRPSTSKTDDSVERVRSLVRSDGRLTLRMFSSELNLNRFTVHQILTQDLDITDELKGIPAEAFQHCYEQRKQRLRSCVAAQGNYFKGDNLDL